MSENNENWNGLDDELTEAYPAQAPSDALRGRVIGMAEARDTRDRRRSPVWQPARSAAALLLVALAAGGLAFTYLLARRGEQAIQLIPSDALLVATLDITPSPAQIPLYHRLEEALKNRHIPEQLDLNSHVENAINVPPLVKRLRPYLAHSYAVALLNPNGADLGNADPVFFAALNDPGAVEQILSRETTPRTVQGLRCYAYKNEAFGAIIAGYLVVSSRMQALPRVDAVAAGRAQSVAGLSDYQTARSALPDDANLMVFVSPTAMARAATEGEHLGANPLRGTPWMAFSATLRDRGIMFDFRGPADLGKFPGLQQAASAPAISPDAYRRLPAGAYGVGCVSQPTYAWRILNSSISDSSAQKGEFDRGLSDFEKETGINVTADVLPAFLGNAWLGVYPRPGSTGGEPDVLILVDDANGADPAGLLAKVRAYLERQSGTKHDGFHFVETMRGSVRVLTLDQKSADAIREQTGLGGDGEGGASGAAGKHRDDGYSLGIAQLGKSVIIASSAAMLDNAIAAYSGGALTLADDPAFTGMRALSTPGAQSVLLVNLPAIMERLRSMLSKNLPVKPGTLNVDDLVGLFGPADSGLVISSRYDGRTVTGTFFLPLEYERLINLAAAAGEHPDRLLNFGDDSAD